MCFFYFKSNSFVDVRNFDSIRNTEVVNEITSIIFLKINLHRNKKVSKEFSIHTL